MISTMAAFHNGGFAESANKNHTMQNVMQHVHQDSTGWREFLVIRCYQSSRRVSYMISARISQVEGFGSRSMRGVKRNDS